MRFELIRGILVRLGWGRVKVLVVVMLLYDCFLIRRGRRLVKFIF